MTAVEYVKATLWAMVMHATLALFMLYMYAMFEFLNGSQSVLECSTKLHSGPASIQPILWHYSTSCLDGKSAA